jgi:DNA-binding NtrC family response regulator
LARLAEGGVLFLDEVDALSPAAQGKLLRFLQERTFKPLGAERFRTANLRIIAATNGNLEALVEQRRFRADLFFRLNILPLRLMPLRERHSDIPLLAECFLRSSSLAGQVTKRFTLRAIEALCDYSWPGNVRELYNLVQRAVVLGEHTEIDAEDLLPNNPCASTTRATGPELSFREAKARAVAEFEKNFVESLLRRCQGNISRASREAGKDRRAFGRLVKKYSLGGCVRVDAEPPSMSDG